LLVSYRTLASTRGAKKGSSVFTAVLRALTSASRRQRCAALPSLTAESTYIGTRL
jgi:hypothetical protein